MLSAFGNQQSAVSFQQPAITKDDKIDTIGMRDFRKYHVWRDSHELVIQIYKLSKTFPSEEQFGITSQLRRAIVSIPTNFAEGAGAKSDKEFGRYISIAIASCSEVEYLLLLIKDLTFIKIETYNELSEKLIYIRKQLFRLREKLT